MIFISSVSLEVSDPDAFLEVHVHGTVNGSAFSIPLHDALNLGLDHHALGFIHTCLTTLKIHHSAAIDNAFLTFYRDMNSRSQS